MDLGLDGFPDLFGICHCGDILLAHLLVDLLAVHVDLAGSVDANADLAAFDFNDRYDDVLPDND